MELGLLVQLLIAHRTRKVMDAPRFVHGCEHISSNHLVAYKTQVAKQLVIMGFTVSQTFLLVVAMTKERFLTLGTYKMLHMPMLS